jgi:hypothetical protein
VQENGDADDDLSISGGGQASLFDGKTLINQGSAQLKAAFTQFYLYDGATIVNEGRLTADSAVLFHSEGTLGGLFVNAAQGTFTKTGSENVEFDGSNGGVVFHNAGFIDVHQGLLTFFGQFQQTSGSTALTGGSIWGPGGFEIAGGAVEGNGVIAAHVVNGGIAAPGFSSGVIQIDGGYVQSAAGALAIEIGGMLPGNSPGHYDQLDVYGTTALGGALSVHLIDGFSPGLGDTFVVVQNDGTDAISGMFFGLAQGQQFDVEGRQFEISYFGGDGNDVTITYINEPPTANAGGPYMVVQGGSVTLDAYATFDANQSTQSLLFEWDFDGDGEFDDAVGPAPQFSAAGIAAPQVRTLSLRVTDGGDLTSVATTSAHITAVTLTPDSLDPSKTALAVGGSLANDQIMFRPGSHAGEIEVSLGGVSQGAFAPTGRLIVYGQDGDDDIQIAASITIPIWVFGGAGDDRIRGGAGDDLLEGGLGDDLLVGGGGRDFLIGGEGADRIIGNTDDDILVAGVTAFDLNEKALREILNEWTSVRTYSERVANIRGSGSGAAFDARLNSSFYLVTDGPQATVIDDGSADVLTGMEGQDWFFAQLDAETLDKITDLKAIELADDLDWILAE